VRAYVRASVLVRGCVSCACFGVCVWMFMFTGVFRCVRVCVVCVRVRVCACVWTRRGVGGTASVYGADL
jgi:hypothetical protein